MRRGRTGMRDLNLALLKPGVTVAQDRLGKALPRPLSQAEETLALALRFVDAKPAKREYRFHKTRKWRFDFAWPDAMVAVEVEGVTYEGGRHQRVEGFNADLEKYEAAMLDGWTVYRCSAAMIKSGRAVEVIMLLLNRTKTQ